MAGKLEGREAGKLLNKAHRKMDVRLEVQRGEFSLAFKHPSLPAAEDG